MADVNNLGEYHVIVFFFCMYSRNYMWKTSRCRFIKEIKGLPWSRGYPDTQILGLESLMSLEDLVQQDFRIRLGKNILSWGVKTMMKV